MLRIEDTLALRSYLKVSHRLVLEKNGKQLMDEDTLLLLRAIREGCSILRAAQVLRKDYKKIWMILSNMEKILGVKLVERISGGYGGGWARLTIAGELLIQEYESLYHTVKLPQVDKLDLIIAGSNCPVLDILVRKLVDIDCNVRYLSVGSYTGVKAVISGSAQIAGIHIQRRIGYNIEYLHSLTVHDLVFIHGYIRSQGLIVPKGNPKEITSLNNILKKNVRFINRNKGSGTRSLIDQYLDKVASKDGRTIDEIKAEVRGYFDIAARSHEEVALAIQFKKADVGFGIETIANHFSLDFIPILNEDFDFVTKKHLLKNKYVNDFIDVLKSQQFINKITSMPGIQPKENIGHIMIL
jgi:putative molybdopterin biosynthesis protein